MLRTISLLKGKTLIFMLPLSLGLWSCNAEKSVPPLFELMDSAQTGIDFSNDLPFDKDFNIYKYRNFYTLNIFNTKEN